MFDLDVLTIGKVFCDMIFTGIPHLPIPGEEVFTDHLYIGPGGGAPLFAIASARLGLKAGLVGEVGDDILGHFLLKSIGDFGVDTTLVKINPEVSTNVTVSLSLAQERSFVTHAKAIPTLQSINWDHVRRARHLHIAGRMQPQDQLELLQRARALGLTISLDYGWIPPDDIERPEYLEILRHADIFLPNKAEALNLTGCSQIDAALQSLAQYTRIVAVKLGSNGAVASIDGQVHMVLGIPVRAVDTTGAGDAFDAGFVYAYLMEETPENWLKYANFCGAMSVRGVGGSSALPTLQQVKDFLSHSQAYEQLGR